MRNRVVIRNAVMLATALLLCGVFGFGQQSPPSDGVGLGNDHLSSNSSVSDVPSMSPNQNTIMTDSGGSTTGDQGIPAFAGSGGAETATEMNSRGTMSVRQATAASAARRSPYGIPVSNQNRATVLQNGNQVNPTIGGPSIAASQGGKGPAQR